MKHARLVAEKRPARAQDIPVSAMVTFITAVLVAFTPLLMAKEESGDL